MTNPVLYFLGSAKAARLGARVIRQRLEERGGKFERDRHNADRRRRRQSFGFFAVESTRGRGRSTREWSTERPAPRRR